MVFSNALAGVSEKELATCLKVFNRMNDNANSGDVQ